MDKGCIRIPPSPTKYNEIQRLYGRHEKIIRFIRLQMGIDMTIQVMLHLIGKSSNPKELQK